MIPITSCDKCNLCKTKKNIVNGVGPIPCDVMFVGEAPGKEEDMIGAPFVGDAGKLLTDVLTQVGLDRKNFFVSNSVKCRPTDEYGDNRHPTPAEIKACSDYLEEEIQKVKPKIIVALGNVALKRLANFSNITKTHGMFFPSEKYNCKIFACYHPAYILRNSSKTNQNNFIQDFLSLKAELNPDKAQISHNYIIIENMEEFKELAEGLSKSNLIAVDIETTGFDSVNDRNKERFGTLHP